MGTVETVDPLSQARATMPTWEIAPEIAQLRLPSPTASRPRTNSAAHTLFDDQAHMLDPRAGDTGLDLGPRCVQDMALPKVLHGRAGGALGKGETSEEGMRMWRF